MHALHGCLTFRRQNACWHSRIWRGFMPPAGWTTRSSLPRAPRRWLEGAGHPGGFSERRGHRAAGGPDSGLVGRATMSALSWAPWHQVVKLRTELKTGELTLSQFAADLYDVAMRTERRPLYEDPAQFFGLTYPTYNLRQLVKDVVLRLAGRTDRAIRQLELTY